MYYPNSSKESLSDCETLPLRIFSGDDRKECTCSMGFVQRYQNAEGARVWPAHGSHRHPSGRDTPPLREASNWRRRVVIGHPGARGGGVVVQAERFAPLGKPHGLDNGDMRPVEALVSSGESEQYAALLPGGRGLNCRSGRKSLMRAAVAPDGL